MKDKFIREEHNLQLSSYVDYNVTEGNIHLCKCPLCHSTNKNSKAIHALKKLFDEWAIRKCFNCSNWSDHPSGFGWCEYKKKDVNRKYYCWKWEKIDNA